MKCIRLLALTLFLAMTGRAGAVDHITCAANWGQVAAALSAATASDGHHDIRVVKGVHVMSGTLLLVLHPDAFLSLRGGYDPGCGSRDLDPANTTISGQGVHALRIEHNRDLLLEGFTVRNLSGLLQSVDGGISIRCGATDSNIRFVTLRHNIFRQLDGKYSGVDAWGAGACLMGFRNNLVTQISAPATQPTFSSVIICSGFFDSMRQGEYVDQNTFVGIQGGSSAQMSAALSICKSGTVAHNLFWANAPRDLDLRPGNAMNVVGNLYDLSPNTPIGGENQGNFTADPMFVNAAGGDYRLQLASPAINKGATMTDLAQDLAGNGRKTGSRTDLGAYESNLNDQTQVLVTNTGDSGAGSLRQAILDANANSNHTLVRFAINGTCGTQSILLNSLLPAITTPVTIDGYSQTGSQANTDPLAFNAKVCVGLTQIGGATVGLRADTGGQLVVRGLWFGNFVGSGSAAIQFLGGADHVVEGVQFSGVLPNGASLSANRINVLVQDGYNLRIGGAAIGQRNLVSGATLHGIAISGAGLATNTVIQNNLIGSNASRTGIDPNGGSGISISGSGAIDILGNILRGNLQSGISISGNSLGVLIRDNEIGFPGQGNLGHGVYVGGGSFGVTIGGSETVDAGGNRIHSNGGAGVRVIDGESVRIRANSIWENDQLGIDLGPAGVTANDPGDGDSGGGNSLQNHPVITGATLLGDQLTVSGMLDTGVNASFAIDLYLNNQCDPSGHGQGAVYVGRVDLATDASGHAAFSQSFEVEAGPMAVLAEVSATAMLLGPTDAGDTSEFSACMPVVELPETLFLDGFED